MTPEELAAIRAEPLTAEETATLRNLVGYGPKGDRLVDLVRAERNATLAALAHIDAITEAVEGMRTYPFKEAPYGDEPHAMVLQSAVLALLRGIPQ